ncbi:PAS domain S-box protein [Palleronia sp. LCG004]|uniref:PAS domain S-box protein n=1 Tax=Palleronia sp. LCG004 TaxID=3079304 RepID=UPI002942D1E2|nr:PAS domain S-box protein [Palleronia sp. LCG004]WOI56095.1 PAS domain S-box protein [Palleronia sp. LCG004]
MIMPPPPVAKSSARTGSDRHATLAPYRILDTPAEVEFDDIAHLARDICGTETALIGFVLEDRQWFKARVGFDAPEIPIEGSVCAHALEGPDLLLIPDLKLDARTDSNPFVTGAPFTRFYAGVRLETPDGTPLGTLCVMDGQPRPGGLTDRQVDGLRRLARQSMSQLELRRLSRDRDRASGEIREANTHHLQIIESALDYAIISMDLEGYVSSWNRGAERIFGWSSAEMCGRPADTFFRPEDVTNGVLAAEMRLAGERGSGTDERWYMRKDGARFFAMGEMMPLNSSSGELVGYLKILRDETKKREIDTHLRIAEERLQIALAASGAVGLWDWMIDTDLLHGDANFARIYGLDPEKTASGLTMEEYQQFVVPEDIGRLRDSIRATFDRGEDFLIEYRVEIEGQPLRWVECKGRLVHDRDGRPERFSGSAVDVTERKHAETESRRLAAIVEQSRDFIGVAHLDGSMAWVNESGRRLVGLSSPESATDTMIEDYFVPAEWSDIATEVFPAVTETGGWRGELRFRHFVTGETIPVIYDIMALRSDAGDVTAYATVTRDIRGQKEAEAKQQLLNEELSHRMKNTLAMVQAIATQTLRGVTEKEAVAAFRKRIHAIASAHDVLLKKNWAAASMEEVVRAVLRMFELDDRFEIAGPPVELGSRATLSLSLLLHELATNALKYGALSSETGRIAIAWSIAEGTPDPDFTLTWSESGGPPPHPPADRGKGFGSRLIAIGLVGTGGCDLGYPAEGFQAEFRAPLPQMKQT